MGRAKFEQESGIKPADWEGRYWARWSDAIHAAGLAPNSLNKAFADDVVFSAYAAFSIELGRLPVTNELKLRRRSDPNFPSHNVFARFGTRSELLDSVKKFCELRPEFELVTQFCDRELSRVASPRELVPARKNSETYAFVYLLKSGRYYKIGKTNSVGRRERELAIQLPDKVVLVHSISTDAPDGIEAYWHRRFASLRKNGEWFNLSATEISAFKRRKFM